MKLQSDSEVMRALMSGRRLRDQGDGEERWLDDSGRLASTNGMAAFPDVTDGDWCMVPQQMSRWGVITEVGEGEYVIDGPLHSTRESAQEQVDAKGGLAFASVVFEVP